MRRLQVAVLVGCLLITGAGTATADVEPPSVPMPEAEPRGPGPLPMPLVRPQRPGPVPMPRLDPGYEPPRELLRDRPPRELRGTLSLPAPEPVPAPEPEPSESTREVVVP